MQNYYRIYRNKHPERLILEAINKPSKTHQNPSVSCTPPFEKSPTKSHRFCVLPPLKNHPSKPIGFVYSPLWKITHQGPSVLCTPPFEKSPTKTHRFCVLPPLKNHCFWWALVSGWAFILANTVFFVRFGDSSICRGAQGAVLRDDLRACQIIQTSLADLIHFRWGRYIVQDEYVGIDMDHFCFDRLQEEYGISVGLIITALMPLNAFILKEKLNRRDCDVRQMRRKVPAYFTLHQITLHTQQCFFVSIFSRSFFIQSPRSVQFLNSFHLIKYSIRDQFLR